MRYLIKKSSIFILAIGLFIISFYSFAYTANAQAYYPAGSDYLRQLCPAGFTFTSAGGGQYICYKFLGVDVGSVYPEYVYNPVYPSYSPIPGCLPGYAYSQLTGQRCGGDSYYDDDDDLRGDDASIESFDVRDGKDDTPEEGDHDAEIMEVRFDVEDGDIRLDRIEFIFEYTGSSSGEDLPWNTFDEIRLLSDGREIERMDTDNKNDWDEEKNDEYSIVFSGLDEVIRENDRANLTLEVDLNSDIDGAGNNKISWDIFIPDDGLRARGGNGRVIYAGDDSENASISIQED